MTTDRQPPAPAEMFTRGRVITAKKLNRLSAAVNEGRSIRRPKRVAGRGLVTAAATAPEVKQFRVVSVQADYLICNEWNGNAAGTVAFNVAKPYLLRNSVTAWNGLTFTFDAGVTERVATRTSDSETETQVVVAAYAVDDVIYAVRRVKGGVGVTVTIDGEDEVLDWLDMNVDGRQWAKKTGT